VRDYAKAGEDKNIDFRVSEEPEEVLIKNGVSSACGVEEGSI